MAPIRPQFSPSSVSTTPAGPSVKEADAWTARLISGGAFFSTTVKDQISNFLGPLGCQIRMFAELGSPANVGKQLKLAMNSARSPTRARASLVFCSLYLPSGSSENRVARLKRKLWPCPSRSAMWPPSLPPYGGPNASNDDAWVTGEW